MAYPEWVQKQREKGTEIRHIGGHYYLYRVTSRRNKEKGRPQKITLGIIGKITEQGIKPSKKRKPKDPQPQIDQTPTVTSPSSPQAGPIPPMVAQPLAQPPKLSAVEHGATTILREIGQPIEAALKQRFGADGLALYICAQLRLVETCALKHIKPLYEQSSLAHYYPDMQVGPNHLTALFQRIGQQRATIVDFFKQFLSPAAHILLDGTKMLSQSEQLGINEPGYNATGSFDSQVNLLYMFSLDQQSPAYYRVVPGHIQDVKAFRLCIEEIGAEKVVVVADKGVTSRENILCLVEKGLQYILPVKRNDSEVDYTALSPVDYRKFDGFFQFHKRSVWHKVYASTEYGKLYHFYDGRLAEQERQDYLERIEKGLAGYTLEEFAAKQPHFGSLILASNLTGVDAKTVYTYYKGRMEIEQLFDTFKNTLQADRTYMRSQEALETWLFVNHISLLLYYGLYRGLKQANLLKQYSPMDVLRSGKQVRKVRLGENWFITEIPSKLQEVLKKTGFRIT